MLRMCKREAAQVNQVAHCKLTPVSLLPCVVSEHQGAENQYTQVSVA